LTYKKINPYLFYINKHGFILLIILIYALFHYFEFWYLSNHLYFVHLFKN